ncbi:MAG TPA: hypothetical protein VG757_05655 [Devosia sp.]|nr:hypothetical protein [Devosia sp.]
MPKPPGGKAGLTIGAHAGAMAWLLLLLIPIFGLPVLRLVLLPARRGPSVPWPAIGIGAALLFALWMGVGQPPRSDPGTTYADADSAMRALIE